MKQFDVGVIGARSELGASLSEALDAQRKKFCVFSRRGAGECSPSCVWLPLHAMGVRINALICVAPAWALPEYFDWLLSCDVRRVVMLSSTSRYVKENSPDIGERRLAERLIHAEKRLEEWARQHGIEWLILRPTMIYGGGRDRNVSAVMRFVKRWRFFPLAGAASGLRQPVHLLDVAQACVAALGMSEPNRAYNLSGAEVLTFRDMVRRCAAAVGVRPWLPVIPVGLLRMALGIVSVLRPRAGWSAGMADRMNRDQIFDHSDATRDLGFDPMPFHPEFSAKSCSEARR